MPQQYRPEGFDTRQFYGQFILTAEEKHAPEGWTVHTSNQWNLYTLALPVRQVCDQSGRWLGWCIGHPVVDGCIDLEQVALSSSGAQVDMNAVDDFYERTSGKWALLLLQPGDGRIFLDPYGSLSTVYSTLEKTAASTPTLLGENHGWDEELINAVGLPENDTWLPSGLTTRKNVRRLMPNHCLNLSNGSVSRHWPTPETNLSVDNDTQGAVARIAAYLEETVATVAKSYPLCFSLTAGMDSRMLLACARPHLETSSFFTFIGGTKSVDVDIPAALAQRFKLDHRFIPTEKASPEELDYWLALTGFSASGAIWKIHKGLQKLDSKRVLLPGTAGEICRRTMQWRPTDQLETKISAAEVLSRCKLPQHPTLLKATETWVTGLAFADTFSFLALTFIEQRLGCWAAPQHYGNTTSAFEFTPFNSRRIFHTAMRLPVEYRRRKQFPIDLIRQTWPELLSFPFNQFTGMKGYFYTNKDRLKKFIKDLIGR